jgi:hypothetical protein
VTWSRRGHRRDGQGPARRGRRPGRLPARRLPAERAAGRDAEEDARRVGRQADASCSSWSWTRTKWSGGCPAAGPAAAASGSGTCCTTRPPAGICDDCGGELFQRDDDSEEDVIRHRLEVYNRADLAADRLLRRRGHPDRHRRDRPGGRDHQPGAGRAAPVRALTRLDVAARERLGGGAVGMRLGREPAIEIKTPEQIERMRAAGLVVARTLRTLAEAVGPRASPPPSSTRSPSARSGRPGRCPRSSATTGTRRRSARR